MKYQNITYSHEHPRIDLSTGKVLITSTEGNITFHNEYIADKTTKGTIYYLYTGKTIYEDK